MEAGRVGLLVAASVQVSAQKSHFPGWPRAHAGHLHASCRVGAVGGGGPSDEPRAGPVWLAEGPAGWKQQCWHRRGGAIGTWGQMAGRCAV